LSQVIDDFAAPIAHVIVLRTEHVLTAPNIDIGLLIEQNHVVRLQDEVLSDSRRGSEVVVGTSEQQERFNDTLTRVGCHTQEQPAQVLYVIGVLQYLTEDWATSQHEDSVLEVLIHVSIDKCSRSYLNGNVSSEAGST
jgi:hypothetical protein